MRIALLHSDHRQFDIDRFRDAWVRAGLDGAEIVPVSPAAVAADPGLADAAFSGVMLAGGPDVLPAAYGQDEQPDAKLSLDVARDALDLAMLARAAQRGVPVFGVCRGLQVLNVAYGGTLVQDLPSCGIAGHAVPPPRDTLAHAVEWTGEPRWLAGLESRLTRVNSRHHQGLDEVGAGLVVVARAPDGVIEAVEDPRADRWVVGVQWHPEDLSQDEQLELFRRFRSACLAPPR